MDSIKVSIVIPNFNQAKYLESSIQSALNQEYDNYEIIVVDDGSTDNSRYILQYYDDRIRYIWQQNKGLGGARNTGISAALGEYIGLLDADDKWKPSFLSRMVELMLDNPKCAACYCSAQGITEGGNKLPQIFGGPAISPEALYGNLIRANFLIPSTMLLRKSVVVDLGLFDQENECIHGCEDWDLWMRMIANDYCIVGTNEQLVYYRIHSSSLSANINGLTQAVTATIEKQFGPEDGRPEGWSADKRRAYGGVYRYHLLTSIQRQENWQAGAGYLRRALVIDPTLAIDLDLFYDLALGSQPAGYRGTKEQLNLADNATLIQELLENVFSSADSVELQPIRKRVYGSAHFALGLVAYNTGDRSMSRRHLRQALSYRPDLWRDHLATRNLAKSFIPKAIIERAKAYLDLN